MNKTITYEATGVKSTVEMREDGFYHELETRKWGSTISARCAKISGARYVNLSTWIGDMNHASHVRYPHKKRHEKLKVDESSVVWVDSAGHYMEVRRGDKTKFAAGERRTWATVDEWLASLTQSERTTQASLATPAVPVKVEEAAVSVVEAVPVAAAVPVVTAEIPAPAVTVTAFDAVKFRETWAQLRDLTRKETGMLRSTHVIQLCQFLLDSRPAAADWLAVNPVWRYTVRAIMQEFGLSAEYQGARDTMLAFLAMF